MKFIIKYDEHYFNWSSIEAAFVKIKTFLFCFLFEGRYILEIIEPNLYHEDFDEYMSKLIMVI